MKLLDRLFRKSKPFSSGAYWAERYAAGRTSGAGSYGRLAAYKAEVINQLVRDRQIASVIEFGSGDGNQASLFDFPAYTGVDVAPQVIAAARVRFADRPGWSFRTLEDFTAAPTRHDMAMSLDVIYHLVEDDVFARYMTTLFDQAARFVLVYASDHDELTRNSHVRHRAYSHWVAENAPAFQSVQTWEHPYPMTDDSDPETTSFASFHLFERRS